MESLVRQINRIIKPAFGQLRKMRETSRWYSDYGPYYVTDQAGRIVAYGIQDLESFLVECQKEE